MEQCCPNPLLQSWSESNTKVYVETVLEPVVQSLIDTLFEEVDWIFQQNLGPATNPNSLKNGSKKHVDCTSVQNLDWVWFTRLLADHTQSWPHNRLPKCVQDFILSFSLYGGGGGVP